MESLEPAQTADFLSADNYIAVGPIVHQQNSLIEYNRVDLSAETQYAYASVHITPIWTNLYTEYEPIFTLIKGSTDYRSIETLQSTGFLRPLS